MYSQLKINQSKKNNKIIWRHEQIDNINGSNAYYVLTDLKGNFIAKDINYNNIFSMFIKGILKK